jgi:phosphatidylinositol alpha-1,6-mannosyltransferase
MRRRRVLVLTPDFPPSPGGIQLLIHRLVRSIPGVEAHVVTLDSPGARAFDASEPITITRTPRGHAPRRTSILMLNGEALRQAMAFRPDVVLSGHIVTAPAAAAIRASLGAPFVQYLHAQEIGAKPALARFAVRTADTSVAVSRHTRNLALRAGARPERLVCVPPGVDEPDSIAMPRTPEPGTILTIARLHDRYKGHDVMLRALPLVRTKVPDVRWVVVGDGRLRPELEQFAHETGVFENVRLLGSAPDSERDYWLRRAAVFAMPSRLPAGGLGGEGFGIVYMEASAHGVPVVAGAVGGALDAVVDGVTGVLIDPTDHLAVANALTELLTDADRARRLGEAGRERSLEFSWSRIGAYVGDVLARTVAHQPLEDFSYART